MPLQEVKEVVNELACGDDTSGFDCSTMEESPASWQQSEEAL